MGTCKYVYQKNTPYFPTSCESHLVDYWKNYPFCFAVLFYFHTAIRRFLHYTIDIFIRYRFRTDGETNQRDPLDKEEHPDRTTGYRRYPARIFVSHHARNYARASDVQRWVHLRKKRHIRMVHVWQIYQSDDQRRTF